MHNRLSFSPQQCFADLTTMKYPERVSPIFCFNNEEELETIAFLKLINLGKNEISEGKFQNTENFFAEMEKEG
jgi:hypothetical protein